MKEVSAYIPCFNNSETLRMTIEGLKNQTWPVHDLFIVDDGSTDQSVPVARQVGVRVVEMGSNQGRGAVRARAMREAKHEFVVGCDATIALAPNFVEDALRWFEQEEVAGVVGRICQPPARNVTERWRGRHLFRENASHEISMRATWATWGCVLRKSRALAAGNYDANLRHSEDAELGERLLAQGNQIVFDPRLEALSIGRNTLPQVLERYWRWNAGKDERTDWRGYFKQIVYATKVMALQDLRAGDPLSVPISLFSPHYQFWRSQKRSFGLR